MGQGPMSLNWTAPELTMHISQGFTEETDIFALGMTMLEIFTGEPPYGRDVTPVAIIVALMVTHNRPIRPPELSGPEERQTQMWELIQDCWAINPTDRPSASSVLNSLQSFAS
ncbi:kinase-like protein [Ceratobasidium sp. AG-I]|nr:kinase-like protein [Ceratobasidium sp. AG-I]